MAERKRLPVFIALRLELVVTTAMVLNYWGYVMSATYTKMEIQVTEFTPHDSTMYLSFG